MLGVKLDVQSQPKENFGLGPNRATSLTLKYKSYATCVPAKFVKQARKNIQEYTSQNLWKTAFKKLERIRSV